MKASAIRYSTHTQTSSIRACVFSAIDFNVSGQVTGAFGAASYSWGGQSSLGDTYTMGTEIPSKGPLITHWDIL
jgi:hypothetical protein